MAETDYDKVPQPFYVKCYQKNDKEGMPYKYFPLEDLAFMAVSAPVVGDIIVGDTQNYVVVERQFEIAESNYRISRCALLVEETDRDVIEG